MRQILFILALFLIFGCTKPADNNPSPPLQPLELLNESLPSDNEQNDTQPQITCEQSCRISTSVSCNGTWIISGIYPNCNCQFNCTTVSDTPSSLPQEAEQNATPANFSLMLDNSMSKINNEFYSIHSGTFTEKSSKWKRTVQTPSDSIEFTPPEVKFNNVAISSLQASGFFIFEGESSKDILGTAIFNVDSTPLDSYGFIGSFDVAYSPTLIKRTLLACRIYNKEYAYSGVIYYFECENEELN